MKGNTKEQLLDDESLNTLMCEVEAIVNGRPLTKLSDVSCDLEPLTTNHLLLLRSGPKLPPGIFRKGNNCSTRQWHQVQNLVNAFWRRWVREDLPLLQEWQKWLKQRRKLKFGDIVLILDKKTPCSSWPLGRVLEVHINQRDGLVCSVRVSTSSSVLVRSVDVLSSWNSKLLQRTISRKSIVVKLILV